jgi:hypothetical protein
MQRAISICCVVAGFVLGGGFTASAQEVIHAVTGTVKSADPTEHSITVLQDNGSTTVYQARTDKKSAISFDKRVAAGSTAADQFKAQGQYVIVFYYGNDDNRTVVALKPLGKGPFTAASGTLKALNKHEVTIEDGKGATETFRIGPDTVGEGMFGVVEGAKLSADKGMQVRVVGTSVDGAPTALFIRAM